MKLLLALVLSIFYSTAIADVIKCKNVFKKSEWGGSDLEPWVDEVYIWLEADRLAKIVFGYELNGKLFGETHEIDCLMDANITKQQCFEKEKFSPADEFHYKWVRITENQTFSKNAKDLIDGFVITHARFVLKIDKSTMYPTLYNNFEYGVDGMFQCDKQWAMEFLKFDRD